MRSSTEGTDERLAHPRTTRRVVRTNLRALCLPAGRHSEQQRADQQNNQWLEPDVGR